MTAMMKKGVVLKNALQLVKRRSSGKRTFVKREDRFWNRPTARFLPAHRRNQRHHTRRAAWEVWLWPSSQMPIISEGMTIFPRCVYILVDDQTGIARDMTYT